jgi:hypothetical protein
MGYRLWYDTGIAVGSRWPDTIAEHLMESDCVIAFISSNAVASDYCQEELFFAMEEHIPIVAVHLEETQLPPGLRMRLSARQAIFRYQFSDDNSFLQKLNKEKVVQCCKAIPTNATNIDVSIPKYSSIEPNSSVPFSLFDKVTKNKKNSSKDYNAYQGTVTIDGTFKLNKLGTFGKGIIIAGFVTDVSRGLVYRNGVLIFSGDIEYLRKGKTNVPIADEGTTVGIRLANFDNIAQHDVIHFFG